jgi:hypothetical protein
MEAILYRPSEESILSKTFDELIEKIEPFLPKDPQSFKDFYHGNGIYGFLPDWGKHVDTVIDSVKDNAVDWWNNFEISDYVDDDSLFFTVLSTVTTSSLELAALYLVAKYIVIPIGKEIVSYCINNIDFDSILNSIQKGIRNSKEKLISAKLKVVAIKNKIVDSLYKTTEKVTAFIEKTKNLVIKFSRNIIDKGQNFINNVTKTTKKITNGFVETAKKVKTNVVETVKKGVNVVVETAYKTKDVIVETAKKVKNVVVEKFNWLKNKLFKNK